jgi:hypothetical protein
MAGRFQIALTSLKMAALAAIIIFGLLHGKIGGEVSNPYTPLGIPLVCRGLGSSSKAFLNSAFPPAKSCMARTHTGV